MKDFAETVVKENGLTVAKPKSIQRAAQRVASKKLDAIRREADARLVKVEQESQAKLDEVKKEAAIEKEKMALEIKAQVPTMVQEQVKEELFKADAMAKKEAWQFRYPDRVNANSDPERKPGSDVPFSYLRRMAQIYPIARACINRRIRQITQLQWDITTIDEIEGEAGYESQMAEVKKFFKYPMGNKTRLREMLTIMIDDILTVDAICFEVQKTRGGQFYKLIPVDPTTIALKVTETGGTPEPPDDAYVQIIQGHRTAAFNLNEMIYESMMRRSITPYGLAPLESLILQAEAAIRGTLYNLNYFRENNVPEGFLELPPDIAQTKELVEQWQTWFDAMVAGDARFTHRLKIIPGGAKYTAAKKPEDMAFERFELWLMQQTCAMFDVPPQDIGMTYQVNKATGKTQENLSNERGLIPLGNFIKEIFDDIVQNWLGFEDLQFIWHDLNPIDMVQEVDTAVKQINAGLLSGDEFRIEHGREPIGLEPYIMGKGGPVLVKDFIAGANADGGQSAGDDSINEEDNNSQTVDDNSQASDDQHPEEITNETKARLQNIELRKWRNALYNDLNAGATLRKQFKCFHLDPETQEFIHKGVAHLTNKFQVKIFFDQFLDPEVKASMTLVKYANKLKEIEHDTNSAH